MLSITKLLSTLLLINLSLSICSDGCLRCGRNQNCLLCDFTSGYIKDQQDCTKSNQSKCSSISQTGRCLTCEAGYYVDSASGFCVEVPNDNRIKNCEIYANLSGCQKCAKKYFVENGKCFPIIDYVPGCKIHGKDICLECDHGKILHPTKERCIEDPREDNCLLYGYLKCNKCKQGYFLNPNYFFRELFENDTLIDFIQVRDFLSETLDGRIDTRIQAPCQPIQIDNCLEYQTFETCKKCERFYFLTKDQKCEFFPHPVIPNCSKYSNYNECTECGQGYFLLNRQECKQVSKIDKCKFYSTTNAVTQCIECDDKYYVTSNVCRERNQTITNCLTYSNTNDFCSKCNDGFGLASNNIKCLGLIDNCQIHNFSVTSGEKFPCVTCKQTHYLSQTQTCEIGAIQNCLIYTSKETCTQCTNSYYLEGNECKQHVSINECSIYNQTQKNICDQCDNSSLLATQKIGCGKIESVVENCTNYSSTTLCTACADRYQLVNGLCQTIPADEHCLRKNQQGECVLCETFYLLVAGFCKQPQEQQVKFCDVMKNDGMVNLFECEECKADTVPFFHSNFKICVKKEERKQTNQIQHCLAYKQNEVIEEDNVNNLEKCISCDDGFFLAKDQLSCVVSCPQALLLDKLVINILISQISEKTYTMNICQDYLDTLPNCKIAVQTGMANLLQCVKCADGYMKIQHFNNMLGSYDDQTVSYTNLKKKFGFSYQGFQRCETKNQITLFLTTGTTTPPTNCEVYNLNDAGYICQRCKFGYTGTVLPGGPNLTCNKEIKGCDRETYYGGLSFDQDNNYTSLVNFSFLNCHKCLYQNQIPFLFIANQSLKPFEITYQDQMASDQGLENGEWMQCLEPTAKSFRMSEKSFTKNFPKNCAVGKFLVDKKKSFKFFDDVKTSVKCLFCKPGYRAEKAQDERSIVKCHKIKNCDHKTEDKWFNSCSQCKPGYKWFYYDQKNDDRRVQFDKCVVAEDKNCMIGNLYQLKTYSSDYSRNRKKCLICKKGFILNQDGICDKIDLPYCLKNQTFGQLPIQNPQKERLMVLLDAIDHNLGCNRCEDGYVGYQVQNGVVCSQSDYIKLGKFAPETKYVTNCLNYGINGNTIVCNRCTYGFILSLNNRFCIPQKVYPNCIIADDQGKVCDKCRKGYVLVEGFCELPKITNCEIYSESENYQKCTQCKDTCMLVDNHCMKGRVQNCQRYNTNKKCLNCFDWYQLLTIKNGDQYCVPISKDFNCKTFTVDSMTNGELKCDKCNSEYAPISETLHLNQSFCINLIPIENCIKYDNETLLSDSSLECLECEKTHYLFTSKCRPRLTLTLNCKKYSFTNDYCEECSQGFYLTNDKKCEAFPSGIFGCKEYSDSSTCISCKKNMYINGNTCTQVESKDRVLFCDYYEGVKKCKKCQFRYFLNKDGVCVPAKAQNCTSYKSITECSACPVNFGFYEDTLTGYINCLFISTPNCEKAEKVYPFNCIICKKFFYEDQGVCLPMETFIPSCQEYESRDRCRKCEDDFVLSFDHQRCIDSTQSSLKAFDTCENNEQTQRPFCQGCRFGFQFFKGQCIKCKLHSLAKGCLFCIGIDQERCLLCKPGYYMDSNGNCVENGGAPTFEPLTNEVETKTEETKTDETKTEETKTDETKTDETKTDETITN